jgi:hypothetical protein
MAFVLPPMIEMTEVEKDMPIGTLSLLVPVATGFCWLEN